MARFKKGSPEAKAYMASIRRERSPRRARRAIGDAKRMKNRRDGKRSKKGTYVVHVVPDALMLGGFALPAFTGINGNNSPVQELMATHSVADAVNYGITSYKTYWAEPVVGIVGGLVAKYVGKKLGLNRIGTKEFKLF